MKILIACEFSGIVRDAFKAKGHDVMSCDLLTTERPGKHYQGDVRIILHRGFDLMIAFPPCTYLTYAGMSKWNDTGREKKRLDALDFFLHLYHKSNIEKICIENPRGYPNQAFRHPDQTIHPYYFGEPELKRTCLWLKNLPELDYSKTIIEKPKPYKTITKSNGRKYNYYYHQGKSAKERGRTFQVIADAMANQWG